MLHRTPILLAGLFASISLSLTASDVTDLKLNEVCASNSSIIADTSFVGDDFDEFGDWIEIFNSGDEAVGLDGLYLRITEEDDEDIYSIEDPGQDLVIQPGGYLVLLADGQPEQGVEHLDFKISSDGAFIELLSSDLLPIDEIGFDFLQSDVSYGRVPDSDEYLFYDTPSPGEGNSTTGYIGQLSPPYFLGAPAFITEPTTFSIHHTSPQVDIFYTTDGTEPDEGSNLYSEPFEVSPGDVVKAIATKEEHLSSYVNSRTFINPAEDITLDIVSLSFNNGDFWGTGGIYSNPYSGDEKLVSVEYYKPNGILQFQQNAGVKIHAPDGRDQKSLRLYARSEYGDHVFNYPFFPQKDVDEHKRIVLRNAGNDGLEIGKTGIRDPLIHELFLSMNPQNNIIAGFRPVHLYLNGNYWGVYNLRERQDEFYIENNYGHTDIDLLERTAQVPSTKYAIAGSWDDYDLMEETAIELDLSNPDNYEIMADWMDIENFVDYQLIEIYIINQDWLSNNLKLWRPQDGSQKWKWLLWDTDWGLGLWYPGYEHGYPDWDALGFALSDWGGWNNDVNTELLQNLVENEDFLWLFASRGADLMNSHLKSETVTSKMESIVTMMENDLPFQFDRWGYSMSSWEDKIAYVQEFVEDRPFYFRQHFQERFDLIDTHNLNLAVNPDGGGKIEVNTIEATTNPWEGIYYEALPVRLKAVAEAGYSFTGWEGIDETEEEIWVDLTSDSTFTALFEYVGGNATPLVINEINYHSGNVDPGEWIEIYNPESSAVNLNGWQFTDGSGNFFNFEQDFYIPPTDFLILGKDTALFQEVYPDVAFYPGEFNFNLNNSGEILQLISPFQEIMDEVPYQDNNPWPSTPDGDGPTLELTATDLNNSEGENWFARSEALGSPGYPNNYIGIEEETSSHFLAKGFPNPAQRQYTLLIDLKHAGEVSLEVYDLFGRKINTIAKSENLSAGIHPFRWNLRNSQGASCRNGLYQVVVSTAGERQVLRMVIGR